MKANSPKTGKPMKVLYTPDKWTFRGEEYDYFHISFEDEDTGLRYTNEETDTIEWNQVTNQYREKHGIPYQDEIINIRKKYCISAYKMSQILGFGANQYRLYEDGEVPSESNGKMIRSIENTSVFLDLLNSSKHLLSDKEFNKISLYVEVLLKQGKDCENVYSRILKLQRGRENGYAQISESRLKNLLLMIIERCDNIYVTKMNKILFFIDFLSFKERGFAISGLSYKALPYGPTPQRWNKVYSYFDEIEQHTIPQYNYEGVIISSREKADTSVFDKKELQIIDDVCFVVSGMTAREISELSHDEPSWIKHKDKQDMIPFENAFLLKAF